MIKPPAKVYRAEWRAVALQPWPYVDVVDMGKWHGGRRKPPEPGQLSRFTATVGLVWTPDPGRSAPAQGADKTNFFILAAHAPG